MKQTIRALGWAIYVLWLIIIVFSVTAVYSAFQVGVALGEKPQASTSGGTMILSLPFSVENNGFYDISDLNITTIVQESSGALVSNSSTVVRLISSGKKVNAAHNISISLDSMTSASLSHLLFYDTDFDIDMSLGLRYAGVIPLKISTNSTMPWGAPLYNLTMGDITVDQYNTTHVKAVLSLSFENHSFFSLNGTIRTEIVNTLNQQIGGSTTPINAPQQSSYLTPLEVLVPLASANFKEARLYFDTSVFSYGPLVIPIA